MSVVIIGAGQAGAWVAKSLRAEGFQGTITLIGNEAHLPYERPPLSKDIALSGQSPETSLLDVVMLKSLQIDFRPLCEIVSIDRHARTVRDCDGQDYRYDKLVIATGGSARRPSFKGANLPGVHTLRTIDDALLIAAKLRKNARILVVGGGWIGLELAASARSKQARVTLVEAGKRLCARSVPPLVSEYLFMLHTAAGVDVQLETTVELVAQVEEGLSVKLVDADPFKVDMIVVGIGLEPNIELAVKAELAVNNGIVVDAYGRTSDEHIYAVGDVANQPSTWADGRIRLESWANAQNQGIAVGRTLAGEITLYDDIPWFWSDQYETNLQVLGIPDKDAQQVMRGNMESGRFCLFQLRNSRIVAVYAVNSARELRQAKKLMKAGVAVRPEHLADTTVKLERL